jgi:hypothetical protein
LVELAELARGHAGEPLGTDPAFEAVPQDMASSAWKNRSRSGARLGVGTKS